MLRSSYSPSRMTSWPDGALLVASPVAHIFNQSLKWGVCPQAWKEVKIIPLPKNAKKTSSLVQTVTLQAFCQFWQNSWRKSSLIKYRAIFLKMVWIQGGVFNMYSTYSDNRCCLIEIYNKKMVWSVLIDFSAAFEVIVYCLKGSPLAVTKMELVFLGST